MQGLSIKPDHSGKVRDTYDLENGNLLIVATDRISADDAVLPDLIPHKGDVLTAMTRFWIESLKEADPHHLITTNLDLPDWFLEQLNNQDLFWAGYRSMIVRKAEVLPVECIVRGYITGSGWKSYQEEGTVCGQQLPAGLLECQKLSEPLFTPSTKAPQGEHDENISYDQLREIVGGTTAALLKYRSLAIYNAAAEYALSQGIIIADTKFEFGMVDGAITLIDEVLTPDSSRFWPLEGYEVGHGQSSLDKQPIRDWLKDNWTDRTQPPPHLPESVIAETTKRYLAAYERLTGMKLVTYSR